MELAIPLGSPTMPPMYRSRYGGLWIDRRDAHEILADRQDRGLVTAAEAEGIAQYIEHGYVVFPKAVDAQLVDEYLDFFQECWDHPPDSVFAHSGGQVLPLSPQLYDKVAKVSSLHHFFPRAGELIFPPAVLRFLTQIYEREPAVFQTMSMRWGSEEPLHIDTGPLALTEPMSMAASWVALEDVQENSGEFQFVPGSHRLPELLHHGTTKAHHGDMLEYGKILNRTSEMCEERGLKTERFMARKGDVLIWHADLMHGGAVIEDRDRTRLSLVAHYMPLGVMPTFYDFSHVTEHAYESGGNCIDGRQARELKEPAVKSDPPAAPAPAPSTVQTLKRHIPLPVKAAARRAADKLGSYLK